MVRSTSGLTEGARTTRLPDVIEARGVRHNNLRDLDVDIPLWCVVAVAGVSGSGKSSLAIGTLYAEGMQRFLEGLSTYSRRRLSQSQRPDVDRIDHLPAALALRQRPPVPGAAQHRRDDERGAQRAPADHVAAGHAHLPQRSPGHAQRLHPGHGDHLPGLRRALHPPGGRVVRVQLLRRLPGLQRDRAAVRGRRRHPGAGRGQEHRRRRRAAVELGRQAALPVRRRAARGAA